MSSFGHPEQYDRGYLATYQPTHFDFDRHLSEQQERPSYSQYSDHSDYNPAYDNLPTPVRSPVNHYRSDQGILLESGQRADTLLSNHSRQDNVEPSYWLNNDPQPGTLTRADKFGQVTGYQEDRESYVSGSEQRAQVDLQPLYPGDRVADAGQDYLLEEVDLGSSGRGTMLQESIGAFQHQSVVSNRGVSSPAMVADDSLGLPNLEELVILLNAHSDVIKHNTAAYIQHLTYRNPELKERLRVLKAIPPLVQLLHSDHPIVHKNASAALRNLSFGPSNDIKHEMMKSGCLSALVSLLSRSRDSEVEELITGVLWNLSSSPDTHPRIMSEALSSLVTLVILPHSGLERRNHEYVATDKDVYWSTLFRNATGVLRNLSWDDKESRRRLRETDGLIEALVHIVRSAIGNNDIDNKAVENCVCTLRNLSYACQEVVDPAYLFRKDVPARKGTDSIGCCGPWPANGQTSSNQKTVIMPPNPGSVLRGRDLLWQPSVAETIYLPLLSDCSNPETLEAATGAVQNLAACDWMPSINFRTQVRKEKGLAILVELLNIGNDRVVGTAATALRNLAIDQRNKELIGKYALEQLIACLPDGEPPDTLGQSSPTNLETIAAVLATLYTVVKGNQDFALGFLQRSGVRRCQHLIKSGAYISTNDPTIPPDDRDKVPRFASLLLLSLWEIRTLRPRYKQAGLREEDMSGPANRWINKKRPPQSPASYPRMNMSRLGTDNDKQNMIERQWQGSGHQNGIAELRADKLHETYVYSNRPGMNESRMYTDDSLIDNGYNTASTVPRAVSGDAFVMDSDMELHGLQPNHDVTAYMYDNQGQEEARYSPHSGRSSHRPLVSGGYQPGYAEVLVRPNSTISHHSAPRTADLSYAVIDHRQNQFPNGLSHDDPLYAQIDRQKKMADRRNMDSNGRVEPLEDANDSWV